MKSNEFARIKINFKTFMPNIKKISAYTQNTCMIHNNLYERNATRTRWNYGR